MHAKWLLTLFFTMRHCSLLVLIPSFPLVDGYASSLDILRWTELACKFYRYYSSAGNHFERKRQSWRCREDVYSGEYVNIYWHMHVYGNSCTHMYASIIVSFGMHICIYMCKYTCNHVCVYVHMRIILPQSHK